MASRRESGTVSGETRPCFQPGCYSLLGGLVQTAFFCLLRSVSPLRRAEGAPSPGHSCVAEVDSPLGKSLEEWRTGGQAWGWLPSGWKLGGAAESRGLRRLMPSSEGTEAAG